MVAAYHSKFNQLFAGLFSCVSILPDVTLYIVRKVMVFPALCLVTFYLYCTHIDWISIKIKIYTIRN